MKGQTGRELFILGVASNPAEYRGIETEKKAEDALRYFRDRKTSFWDGRIIEEFRSTMHFSSSDMQGIDFIVVFETPDGEREVLDLQVKSRWSLQEQRSYGARGICYVAIWQEEHGDEARDRVAVAIANFLRIQDEIRRKREANIWQKIWRFFREKILRRKEPKKIKKMRCKGCKRFFYTSFLPEGCPNPYCGSEKSGEFQILP